MANKTNKNIWQIIDDVKHCFEENKPGIVLKNLTAAQDCLLTVWYQCQTSHHRL